MNGACLVSWLSVVVPPMELSRPSLSGGKMVILRATTGREIQTFGLLRVRMSKVRNKESSNNPKYTSKREALRKENVWPQTMRIPCFNKRYRINSFTILFPAKNAPRRPAPGGPVAIAGGHASTRQNTAFSTCSYGAYLPGPFALHSVWIVLRRCVGPW